MSAEANGRAFLGLIRYVKDQHGQAALDAAVASGGLALRPIFSQPIRIMRWYPYDGFIAFLQALQRSVGQGDPRFYRALGAFAGERDLGTVFRIYRALASPERLIRACEKVWPSYYRGAGRMEALRWTAEDTTLRIVEFPSMHPAHCRLMEGWMLSTMKQIGVAVDEGAAEVECAGKGGRWHEFHCTWKRK